MAVTGKSFAATLQRSIQRSSELLSYAFLEWILIALLLVNSLFNYFITKFATFFSLHKPCLWCSRLDSIFENKLVRFSDLLCESHAAEISRPEMLGNNGGEKSGSVECRKCCGGERFGARFGCGDSFCSGDLLDEDRLSSSSMFICYEKEAMEDIKEDFGDDQSRARDGEEKKQGSATMSSREVFTGEELRSLQINVRKAVMTKLNDLPATEKPVNLVHFSGTESEEQKQISRDQAISKDCSSSSHGSETYKVPELAPTEIGQNLEKTTKNSGEAVDPISTIEQLKSALSAVYAELDEERSASAIAANQTMAMITRLQDEKAAMQMEALQYQRIMEEQSEYDQEALQLLNDLMVKRENEKRELERELEVCRRIILNHEQRDRNDEEDEDPIVNLEEIALDCANNMSVLDESLTEFEEERISILDQLRSLEEKIVKLNDEGDEFSGGSLAKKLLPFLDAVEGETEPAIEEEVGLVYERLQALEADREFLNNCMSSVKKGDKGVGLLEEILQHLRDLRTIELHMRTDSGDEAHVDEIPAIF